FSADAAVTLVLAGKVNAIGASGLEDDRTATDPGENVLRCCGGLDRRVRTAEEGGEVFLKIPSCVFADQAEFRLFHLALAERIGTECPSVLCPVETSGRIR